MGKLSRRSFLKMGAIGAGAGATLAFANTKASKKRECDRPQ
ncbi:Formate dehydrogenase-O, major subunit [Helicobacter bizzozeronii CCUG 35545]|nr:Formate dehydrogenase-O, major subunit [Helicobacter bizzozeronii CCUG 35545]